MMALAPSLPPSPSDSDNSYGTDNTLEVETFVLLAVLAMFLLHILGSLRRLSGNSFLHGIVMGVNTLSYPLVSYTIGLMRSSDWYYDDFAVWAVFLLLLLGSTDNVTACRLNDIDNWKTMHVKHLYKVFLLVYVVVTFGRELKYLLLPLSGIVLVGVLKSYVRIASLRMVSKPYLCRSAKVIADYMEHEENNDDYQNQLVPSFNPVTMVGYRYMVAGEKYYCKKEEDERHAGARHTPLYRADDILEVITVENIWQCNGKLLAHERGNKLKDLCLSIALSKMLNRRFAGFRLSEAELDKTRDFVLKGLLTAGDKPHERAFKVIEEELVFVHDNFYTRYSYLYQKGRYLAPCFPVVMIGLCLWLTFIALNADHKCNRNPNEQWKSYCQHYLENTTIFIIVVLAVLEAYQLYLYIASGWFKVALIRSYVSRPFLQRNGCFLEMIIGLVLRFKPFRPWKNKLGQYCILRNLGHRSNTRNFLHYATLRLMDKKRAKKWHKNSVKLSEKLKKAIVGSLRGSNGRLTNGIASLKKYGVHGHLSWACYATHAAPEGSVTRTILVWHIATTLCEHYRLDAHVRNEDDVTTACTLSKYCMHLLAFAPHLLPDHSSISEPLLEQSINELRRRITEAGRRAKTIQDKCDVLMEISTQDVKHDCEGLLVAQGARLAKDLIKHIPEPTLRWRILSEFWAEMMLYVSPSNDARAHLEGLAKGGEFITHLWALLTHAGVLKRGSKDVV